MTLTGFGCDGEAKSEFSKCHCIEYSSSLWLCPIHSIKSISVSPSLSLSLSLDHSVYVYDILLEIVGCSSHSMPDCINGQTVYETMVVMVGNVSNCICRKRIEAEKLTVKLIMKEMFNKMQLLSHSQKFKIMYKRFFRMVFVCYNIPIGLSR